MPLLRFTPSVPTNLVVVFCAALSLSLSHPKLWLPLWELRQVGRSQALGAVGTFWRSVRSFAASGDRSGLRIPLLHELNLLAGTLLPVIH